MGGVWRGSEGLQGLDALSHAANDVVAMAVRPFSPTGRYVLRTLGL